MDSDHDRELNGAMASGMDLAGSYDRVADAYAASMGDDTAAKPFDRKLLDWLIEKVGDKGLICDLGCGPGAIAAYLHRRGAPVCGIDISAGMVAQARRLWPDIPFSQGDLRALTTVPDQAFAGIAAFYSLIHTAPEEIVPALTELRRVLVMGGPLLMAFHLGGHAIQLDSWFERPVALTSWFFTREQMKQWLLQAGFSLEEAIERDPYPEVEIQTRRAYLFARA